MENELDYIQKFHTSDNIIVQVITDVATPPVSYLKSLTDQDNKEFITLETYPIGDGYCHYINLNGLEDDVWQVVIGGHRSAPFEVCEDERLLENTRKISYSSSTNDTMFDNVFLMNGEKVVFDFRVECGFKSNGLQPKLDAETFRDQHQNIHHLYSAAYLVETLTFGSAHGLPAIYCDFLNRIFCLDEVELDGKKIVRSENSVPEKVQLMDNSQRYVLTMDVELQGVDDLTDRTDDVLRYITDESGNVIIDESGNQLLAEID